MGCKDTVLPDPLLKNHSVKCLTFGENIRKPHKDSLCLFRTPALHLRGTERRVAETSKLFNLFFEKTRGTDPANFRGVCMDDNAAVEGNAQADVFLHDTDIVEGFMIGELLRSSVGKHSITVPLLRYNNHICRVSNINALFQACHYSSCDEFTKRAQHPERHMTACKEKNKQVFPKSGYQLRETLFDKLVSFNFPYSDDQTLFTNIAIFDFESICVQEDKLHDADATTWIGTHGLKSVSISSNLIEQPIFLCNSNPAAWFSHLLMLLMS